MVRERRRTLGLTQAEVAEYAGITQPALSGIEGGGGVHPHIVTGYHPPEALEPAIHPDGRLDLRTLSALMTAPLAALATTPKNPVWHFPVRIRPRSTSWPWPSPSGPYSRSSASRRRTGAPRP
ncbi:helix-turn-helix domain-containing protein [Actinomadura scrupuli]|uniref:helix-turn-helix domain-containing protein n=1 Tax=Actinomadura scrupuli TaxID=559629 RepID=UPI003D9790C6